MQTEQEKVLDAVRKHALHYFDDRRNGVYTYMLDEQGIDYTGWNISPDGRVIYTIENMYVVEEDSKPDEGYYMVVVEAEPEVPDGHLFEVQVDDAGKINISWHGC